MTIQTNIFKQGISLSRPSIQRTGSDINIDLMKLGPTDVREQYILDRFLEGHVPSIVTSFKPITINFIGAISKKQRSLTIFVSGDYVSLGTDNDYVRCPISPLTAQILFDKVGCIMPTIELVDIIWKNADIKLNPLPWGPPYDASMMSSDRFIQHSQKIDLQLKDQDNLMEKLIAGHKKDVVITDRLIKTPNQVAIYGWHNKSGIPIQPLYLGHENTYKDYSHGLRFVSREIWNDTGLCIDIIDAMKDPEIYVAFGKTISTIWRQPTTKK